MAENEEKEELFDLQKRASRLAFLQQLLIRPQHDRTYMFRAFLHASRSSRLLWDAGVENKKVNWRKEWEKDLRWKNKKELKIARNRYKNMKSVLRKEGFLSSEGAVTDAGKRYVKNKLKQIKSGEKKVIPLVRTYEKIQSRTVTLVSYDIPEKMRWEREWLRTALKNMGFKMLQKSVWVGNALLPKKFVDNLQDIGVLKYVQIVKITKAGSLRVQ